MTEPTAEGWRRLARHPDGRPVLLFDDLVARYPERYGDPDMPQQPRPDKAPQPGAQPSEKPATPPPAASTPAPPPPPPAPPASTPVDPAAPAPADAPAPTPADPRPPIAPVQPQPSLPNSIGVDDGPPQYGDGEPFQITSAGNRHGYGVLDSVGRLVAAPHAEAAPIDLDAVAMVDPTLESFMVLQSDVWEEVLPLGTTTPSYTLKFSRGMRVPASQLAGLKARVQEPVAVTEQTLETK